VHAAGLAGGGIMALKTAQAAEHVLLPKVVGSVVLAEAVASEPLDFMALCSSYTSLLGGAGQVDYCAANAFLDTFAQARSQAGLRTISINWSAWQEVGMAVNTPVPEQLREARGLNLANGIRTAEGQTAFSRILAEPLPQVVVSPQDFDRLTTWFANRQTDQPTDSAALATATAGMAASVGHARPRLSTAFAAASSDVEQQLVDMWRTLLGIAEIGIHDSFFDLGGHSLLATQLLARVQHQFGVDLPLRSIFELQTIAELAERIDNLRLAEQVHADGGVVVSGDREEIEL
jgi:acyl carrier protein